MICKVLIPMVFSYEPLTKDSLFLYLKLSNCDSDNFEEFLRRFHFELSEWRQYTLLDVPLSVGMEHAQTLHEKGLQILETLNQAYDLVVVLDEAQLLLNTPIPLPVRLDDF